MGSDPKPRQLSPESVHIIYGALFALLAIAALFALMFVRSLTDDSTQSSGITNTVPVLTNTVKVASTSDTATYASESAAITFTNENATNNIYVHGQAVDSNGCTQLKKANAAWTLVVHRTEATNGAACTANNNDCYTYLTAAAEAIMTEDVCTEDGTDIIHQFEFTVPLWSYADPTSASAPTYSAGTWTASVGVTDSAGGAATPGTDTFEINTFNALSVGGTVDFSDDAGGSSLALGFSPTGAQESSMTVTNTGNNTIDVELSGSALDCGAGYADIPVSNSKYSSAALTAYASMTALSATPTELNGFALAKSNNGAAATSNVFWKLSIPATGVAGTCSSTITVGANDNDGI